MSAPVDALAMLDAMVLRAHQAAVKSGVKSDLAAAKLGARHEGADRLTEVKTRWVADYGNLRDAVAGLLAAVDKVNALSLETDGATCEWPEAVAAASALRAARFGVGGAA